MKNKKRNSAENNTEKEMKKARKQARKQAKEARKKSIERLNHLYSEMVAIAFKNGLAIRIDDKDRTVIQDIETGNIIYMHEQKEQLERYAFATAMAHGYNAPQEEEEVEHQDEAVTEYHEYQDEAEPEVVESPNEILNGEPYEILEPMKCAHSVS